MLIFVLKKEDYKFAPLPIETNGGVGRTLKHIVNNGIDRKVDIKEESGKVRMRKSSMLKNNWWIKFSCNWYRRITMMIQDKYYNA